MMMPEQSFRSVLAVLKIHLHIMMPEQSFCSVLALLNLRHPNETRTKLPQRFGCCEIESSS
ncbi:MAG TPA: hypothetical protein VK133_01095 [Amoebophilaceae bacterium]|nr:hypothetical protein [Amoebophilaceae bacterium]